MKEQIQASLLAEVEAYVQNSANSTHEKVQNKLKSMQQRNAEIVKVKADAKIQRKRDDHDHTYIDYDVHMQYFIKQKDKMYIEENIEKYVASFYKNKLYDHHEISILDEQRSQADIEDEDIVEVENGEERISYHYDRRKAVQYAERWWNSYNPQYKKFEVDCTNFISQCLHEGGAPMRGYPNKGQGWWMRNNSWSYSWSVANSLRSYLGNSKSGLRARQVQSPEELKLGDVICYDFQGDGRFDHNTIVTGKDANGMPLVNAHTYNSRMRYWAYEDSTAYTPNIKYKFYTIVDDA